MFSKFFYPKEVVALLDRLQKRAEQVADKHKEGYYDALFTEMKAEFELYLEKRVLPNLEPNTQMRFLNISFPMNNRNREVFFFRLPVTHKDNIMFDVSGLTRPIYCRGLNPCAFNASTERTLLDKFVLGSRSAKVLKDPEEFYDLVHFALIRRNGITQRHVETKRLWGNSLPWADCIVSKPARKRSWFRRLANLV